MKVETSGVQHSENAGLGLRTAHAQKYAAGVPEFFSYLSVEPGYE